MAGGFDASSSPVEPVTHAGAFSKHDGFTLNGCIEIDELRRTQFQQKWGIKKAFQSFSECGRSGEYDVISICSPTALHEEHLLAASELAPSLVVCEKPLTDSMRSAINLHRIYQEKKIPLAVNYSRRWDPRVQELRTELDKGEWGKVVAIFGIYNGGWINNGSHMVDLLMQLFGELKVVKAWDNRHDEAHGDTNLSAILIATGELPVTIYGIGNSGYSIFELRIVTTEGVVDMERGGGSWRFRTVEASRMFRGFSHLGKAQESSGNLSQLMRYAVENIYGFLNCGEELKCTGNTAVQVLRVCHEARECVVQV